MDNNSHEMWNLVVFLDKATTLKMLSIVNFRGIFNVDFAHFQFSPIPYINMLLRRPVTGLSFMSLCSVFFSVTMIQFQPSLP